MSSICRLSGIGRRGFHSAALLRSTKPVTTGTSGDVSSTAPNAGTGATPRGSAAGFPGIPRVRPTILDRRFLVWSGHFKSTAEVPTIIEFDVVRKAREWARIRINISFAGIVVVCCVIAVYLGKQAAKRGESLEKQNLDWHKEIKKEHERTLNNVK